MKTLNELKKELLADGVIDAAEVVELKEVLYADGVIDKSEAEFLFELNDAVSGKNNHESWNKFFVDAITSFILEDGVIDAEEVDWLYAKVASDGRVDEVEKELLLNLKQNTKTFPEKLSALL